VYSSASFRARKDCEKEETGLLAVEGEKKFRNQSAFQTTNLILNKRT